MVNTWKRECSYCTRVQIEDGEKEQLGNRTHIRNQEGTRKRPSWDRNSETISRRAVKKRVE